MEEKIAKNLYEQHQHTHRLIADQNRINNEQQNDNQRLIADQMRINNERQNDNQRVLTKICDQLLALNRNLTNHAHQ